MPPTSADPSKEQLVLLVDWDRVAAYGGQSVLVLQGTLHVHHPCEWTAVRIEDGFCYPLPGWTSDGVVLRNGDLVDHWELGFPASTSDNILWISSGPLNFNLASVTNEVPKLDPRKSPKEAPKPAFWTRKLGLAGVRCRPN